MMMTKLLTNCGLTSLPKKYQKNITFSKDVKKLSFRHKFIASNTTLLFLSWAWVCQAIFFLFFRFVFWMIIIKTLVASHWIPLPEEWSETPKEFYGLLQTISLGLSDCSVRSGLKGWKSVQKYYLKFVTQISWLVSLEYQLLL